MVAPSPLTVALAQYPLTPHETWEAFEVYQTGWIEEAAGRGTELLVFPEYAGLAVLSINAALDTQETLGEQLARAQQWVSRYVGLHQRLAVCRGIWVLVGSIPVAADRDQTTFYNRAWLCSPDGTVFQVDKQILTRFERETGVIVPASAPPEVIPTPWGGLGVLICYDSEFPQLARHLVAPPEGATLLAVPSCTDTLAGYHRVRVGCMARALEGQCVVLHSPLLGEMVPACELVDTAMGAAAAYAPMDTLMTDTGVLIQGEWNVPGWVILTLDISLVQNVRHHGQTLNYQDWSVASSRLGEFQR